MTRRNFLHPKLLRPSLAPAKFGHMEAQTPQIVTVAVAAEEWGVDRRTALRWIAAGKVTAEKIADGKTNAYVLTRTEVERVKREEAAA